MKQEFDIFNGDIDKLKAYITKQKTKVSRYASEMVKEVSNEIKENVIKNTNTITNGEIDEELAYTMQTVREGMLMDTINNNHIKIINVSEEATYAEFGTGMIGKGQPHPNNSLGWEYDVNNHGERGWRYIGVRGTLVRTLGYPSFAIYHNSFQDTLTDLHSISSKTFERVFKND